MTHLKQTNARPQKNFLYLFKYGGTSELRPSMVN